MPTLKLLPLVLAAGVLAAPAAAQTPSVGVHAIFQGGERSGFRVGDGLFVDVRGAKPAKVCWSPAPINRPACGRILTGAPSQTGTTTITVTLPGGRTKSIAFPVGSARKHADGGHAAPAVIDCPRLTLWGNYSGGRLRDKRTTLAQNRPVALYNRIGPGIIFMWDYATGIGGFAKERCARTGLPG